MTATHNVRIEALLREAAPAATWPATPDLRAAVLDRITRERLVPGATTPVVTLPPRSRPPVLRLGRALAVALVAILVLAGIAAALGFRLPGLDIVFVDRLPPAGSGLALGSAVPLEEARAVDRPRVLVPAALPAPDTAFVIGTGNSRLVTLAYRAAPGEPTLTGSDLSLTVTAAPGRADQAMLQKRLGPGTTLDPVAVDGSQGWWISGAPHEILVLRPDGDAIVLRSAFAGDTLVFNRDGTLYRLESALGRDATIRIAESMP